MITDRTDSDYLMWAVTHAGNDSARRAVRWSHVAELLGLGSGYATIMCRRFDLNPDELIGGCDDCEETESLICSCNANDYGIEL